MVRLLRYISAAALVSVSSAVPMVRRDTGVDTSPLEAPVSAPNGILESDSPTSTDSNMAAASTMPPAMISSMAMPPPMASSMAMPPPMASSMAMPPPMASSMAMPPPPMASPMTYGSGSSSWGSDYDNCVQQCAASHPMPSMVWTPSATQSSQNSGGSVGSGATHTVIVAPTKGVLRYIPAFTNASVGDTVSFVWGAGPHTVTQSSALEVCNKTSAPGAFASGAQNQSFVFNQVINNTNPIWFYCGIPTHCQKGMFGGINVGQPDPTMSSSSSAFMPLSSMMANLTSTNPDMSGLWSATKAVVGNDAYANSWGMNTNCAGLDQNALMQVATNVMYMQTVVHANPNARKNGVFAVTDVGNLTIPADMSTASGMNSSMPTSASNSVSAAAASSAMPAAASSTAKSNGAGSVTASGVVIGLTAIIATFVAL